MKIQKTNEIGNILLKRRFFEKDGKIWRIMKVQDGAIKEIRYICTTRAKKTLAKIQYDNHDNCHCNVCWNVQ